MKFFLVGTQRNRISEFFSVPGTKRYPRFLNFEGYQGIAHADPWSDQLIWNVRVNILVGTHNFYLTGTHRYTSVSIATQNLFSRLYSVPIGTKIFWNSIDTGRYPGTQYHGTHPSWKENRVFKTNVFLYQIVFKTNPFETNIFKTNQKKKKRFNLI